MRIRLARFAVVSVVAWATLSSFAASAVGGLPDRPSARAGERALTLATPLPSALVIARVGTDDRVEARGGERRLELRHLHWLGVLAAVAAIAATCRGLVLADGGTRRRPPEVSSPPARSPPSPSAVLAV